MIGKDFTFRGQTISTTTADFQIGLQIVQWKTLDVSDESVNVQGYHGIKLSPTYARGRRITLEGIILADDHEGSSKGMDYLETLFELQDNTSTVQLYPFAVTDEQDRVWVIQAKIKEPVSIDIGDDDHLQGTTRRFRVVLQSQDPKYYSENPTIIEGSESHFGGAKLGVKLGVKLDEHYNEIQVISTGQSEAPLKIVLDILSGVQSPLSIKNETTGTYFDLDITATNGDQIIINSITKTVTKNGTNILAQRLPGSIRPTVKNSAIYTIHDQEGGLFESDFDITITFNDEFL